MLLVGALGVGVFVLLRPSTGTPGTAATEPPVPEFSFHLARVRVSAVDEKPAKGDRDTVVAEIHRVLDKLYTGAFVDPSRWHEGTFPDLPGFFEGAAAERAVEDVDDLTLGGAAAEIRRVEPRRSRLTLSLLFDDEEAPVSAFADAEFRAGGTARDGRRLRIEHDARYLLRMTQGTWRIVGYEVNGELTALESAGGEG